MSSIVKPKVSEDDAGSTVISYDVSDDVIKFRSSPGYVDFRLFGQNQSQRMIGGDIKVRLSSAYLSAVNGGNEEFSTQLMMLEAVLSAGSAKLVDDLLDCLVFSTSFTGVAKLAQIRRGITIVRRIADVLVGRPEYIAAFQSVFPANS